MGGWLNVKGLRRSPSRLVAGDGSENDGREEGGKATGAGGQAGGTLLHWRRKGPGGGRSVTVTAAAPGADLTITKQATTSWQGG